MLKDQLLLGASELGKLKARAETLRTRLSSDRDELAMVEKHLNMFDSIQGVSIVCLLLSCHYPRLHSDLMLAILCLFAPAVHSGGFAEALRGCTQTRVRYSFQRVRLPPLVPEAA